MAITGKARKFKSSLLTILIILVTPIVLTLITHNFVLQGYRVLGASMDPNLHESDYLLISKFSYTVNPKHIPARGDIVVFRFPRDTSRTFVKRVIGLPGERVVIKNGKVTVYNKQNKSGFNPDTKYEHKDTSTINEVDERVKEGSVFVLGDNRGPDGSYDSRAWGDLEVSYIIGTAELRLLPFDQAKTL